MTISLTVLRKELREHLGRGDETSMPDVDRPEGWRNEDVDLLLNRSFWEIIDKFPFREKEATTTFVTVVGDSFYGLPTSFEALRHLAIKDLSSEEWSSLDRMGIDWHERESEDGVDARGKPSRYFRDANGIRLQLVPDDVYTIRVKYWITLADLTTSNETPSIPQVWHEVILYGGLWRAQFRQEEYNKAQVVKNHQIALVASITPVEAKEEFDSARAGVELPEELTKI